MKKLKFKKLVKQRNIENVVYVIFDEVTPIYVGMAEKQSVQARMLNHALNYFTRSPSSQLSKIMFKVKSDYFEWEIGVSSLDQVKNLIGKRSCCLKCAEKDLYLFYRKKGYELKGNTKTPHGCKTSQTK